MRAGQQGRCRRGGAAAALALCLAALPLRAAPGPDAGPVLARCEAALADGLYAAAETPLTALLAQRGLEPAQRAQAETLLMRALYGQRKYAAILERTPSKPQAAEAAYWRALALYELNRADEALALLVPRNGDTAPDAANAARAGRLRAWAFLRAGDTNAALAAFAELDRLYPDSAAAAAARFEWGRALLRAGRAAEARPVLERFVDGATPGPAAWEGGLLLGRAAAALEDWAAASNRFDAAATDAQAGPDARAEAWLAAAELWAGRPGAEAGAVDAARKAVDLAREPDVRADAELMLGTLLLRAERIAEGVETLRAFVTRRPSDPRAADTQLAVAATLLDAARPAEACEAYQRYLETFTNAAGRAEAYAGKGICLLEQDRHAEAAEAFERAGASAPDPARGRAFLFKAGDAWFAAGRYRPATNIYRRVLAEGAETDLAPRALFQLAESTARLGDLSPAITHFGALAESGADARLAEEALLRVAELEAERGRLGAALDAYDRVMTLYPEGAFFAEALYGRGTTLCSLFRFGEALADFRRAAEAAEGARAEEALYMQSLCLYWMGRDAEGEDAARTFLARYPESPRAADALFAMAKADYNRQRYRAAESNFVAFVARFPDNPRAPDALLRAGLAAAREADYVRSVECLTRLIKTYPESERVVQARMGQADGQAELGNFADAILILEEIIHKYPDHELVDLAWARKGDFLFMLGAEAPQRFRGSIEAYRVVVNRAGADIGLATQCRYKIGRCLEKLNQPADAFEQYYFQVILRFFEERERGVWHDASAKIWFTSAAFNAAEIMETRKDWRAVVNVLERVVQAGVPAAGEARERIAAIKAEHWWLF
jgi:TolA-binding protein